MEFEDIKKEAVNIDDIKMLINQKEASEYKIMSIDINAPSKNKYRIEFSYSQKFKQLLEPFQEELLEISENMYNRYRNLIYKNIKIPENITYTILDVSIGSNILGNYIIIDIPLLRLITCDIEKRDKIYLRYISKKVQCITNELTVNLHSFINDYLSSYTKMPEINEFEFIMYYDGVNVLYNDFIQTNKFDYELEKYNIYKLVCNENLLDKVEDIVFNNCTYLSKKKYYKITFNYENGQVYNLNCLPLISRLAYSC